MRQQCSEKTYRCDLCALVLQDFNDCLPGFQIAVFDCTFFVPGAFDGGQNLGLLIETSEGRWKHVCGQFSPNLRAATTTATTTTTTTTTTQQHGNNNKIKRRQRQQRQRQRQQQQQQQQQQERTTHNQQPVKGLDNPTNQFRPIKNKLWLNLYWEGGKYKGDGATPIIAKSCM